jgi:hypothetical protein
MVNLSSYSTQEITSNFIDSNFLLLCSCYCYFVIDSNIFVHININFPKYI